MEIDNSATTTTAEVAVVDKCNTVGCNRPASMYVNSIPNLPNSNNHFRACPTCLKLGLPVPTSRFCSQECFKGSWAVHKLLHKAAGPEKEVTSSKPQVHSNPSISHL